MILGSYERGGKEEDGRIYEERKENWSFVEEIDGWRDG